MVPQRYCQNPQDEARPGSYRTPSSFSEIHHPVGSAPFSRSHLFARSSSGIAFFDADSSSSASSSSSSSPSAPLLLRVLLAFEVGLALAFPLEEETGAASGFLSLIRAASYLSPRSDLRCLHERALTGTPPYECRRKNQGASRELLNWSLTWFLHAWIVGRCRQQSKTNL